MNQLNRDFSIMREDDCLAFSEEDGSFWWREWVEPATTQQECQNSDTTRFGCLLPGPENQLLWLNTSECECRGFFFHLSIFQFLLFILFEPLFICMCVIRWCFSVFMGLDTRKMDRWYSQAFDLGFSRTHRTVCMERSIVILVA